MLEKLKSALNVLGGFDLPIVHIAGSKGKGTVAFLLAKILELNDKKTGLFTSPPIFENEEMISINGVQISTEELKIMSQKVKNIDENLSEFEVLTLVAFLYFKEKNCDICVIECGLGGLNDATNIAENKLLTILTHVELEHADVLGKTLTEITKQKLGICRKGVPLITSKKQKKEVTDEIEILDIKPVFAHEYELSNHNSESSGIAITAGKILGCKIDEFVISELSKVIIPGRFEIIPFGPHKIILDGAHTFDSINYVLDLTNDYKKNNDFLDAKFCIHILKDKDPNLWKLFPQKNTIWVPITDERAGTCPSGLTAKTVQEVLSEIEQKKEPSLVVFVGSFRLVKNVKKELVKLV
ncbi:MAG: Mur ligase family protein [Candidatus Gracilibacteria bacterium]